MNENVKMEIPIKIMEEYINDQLVLFRVTHTNIYGKSNFYGEDNEIEFQHTIQILVPNLETPVKLKSGFYKCAKRNYINQNNLLLQGSSSIPYPTSMTTFCHTDDLFQVSLSQEQAKVIAKRLPPGFSVNLWRYTKREVTKKVQQDLSSEDEHKIIKKQCLEQQKFNDEIKRCLALLQRLKRHPSAAPFLRRLENVNYPQELEYVDLQIVEQNLKNGIYLTATQFWADVKKIWQMSYTMNYKGSQIYAMTQEIEQHFNELYRELDKPFAAQKPKEQKPMEQQIQKKSQQSNASVHKKPRHTGVQREAKPVAVNKMDLPMNLQEKKTLVLNIRNLPAEHLRGVWEIVSDGIKIHDQSEELEFDIDTLAVKKTRLLEKYVNQKLEYLKKIQNKKTEEAQITESADKIVHKANTTHHFAPIPTTQHGNEDDTGDSSFSSDGDESD